MVYRLPLQSGQPWPPIGGPLLDRDIRELPGSVPRNNALSTTSAAILTANPRRRLVVISNDDTAIVCYLARGQTAIVNAGIRLGPGETLIDQPDIFGRMYYGVWSAVAASGTPELTVSEE